MDIRCALKGNMQDVDILQSGHPFSKYARKREGRDFQKFTLVRYQSSQVRKFAHKVKWSFFSTNTYLIDDPK